MRCPYCATLENKVIDSRLSQGGEVIRRRRECEGCGRRYTTYERVEQALPLVVKKDGRRQPFDRDKILAGLRRSCAKRDISAEALERVKETQAKHSAEIEGLEAQRAELLAKMTDDHRDLYERLLARLGDSAVAEVRDEICQGCLLKIRPEQVSLVRGGTTMVTCSDCGRILWGKFG